MHKAISYWSMEHGLEATHSIEKALEDAHDAGFSHLELAVSDTGVLTFDTNLETVRRTIEASPVSMSVSVPSLARGMSWGQTLRASYELS